MAQDINIAGATFEDVPAVSLQSTGGNTVIYNDLSGVNGIVKSDGNGGVSAAVPGVDFKTTFYGECTGTATAQTATIPGITEYYDGLTIMLRFNVGTQRCATININGIGNAYLRVLADGASATSTSTSYMPSGYSMLFAYDAATNIFHGAWSYDSNSKDTLLPSSMRRYVGSNVLHGYKLCGVDALGKLQPLTLEAGTGTTKTPNSTPISPDLFYVYTNSTDVAVGSTVSASYIAIAAPASTGTYTFNETLPKYCTIYLRGTINDAGMFVLDTSSATSWYVLLPNNLSTLNLSSYFDTTHTYILIGFTYSTNNYYWLNPAHPRYMYDGTGLVPYEVGYVKAYVNSLNGNGVSY